MNTRDDFEEQLARTLKAVAASIPRANGDGRHVRPKHPRRIAVLGASAFGITGLAVLVWALVIRDQPSPIAPTGPQASSSPIAANSSPTTARTTTTTPTTSTAPATTTTIAKPFGFTALVLSQPPDGYEFAYAHYESDSDKMYGLVNYRPIDGIGPSFDIILRPWSDFGADMSQRRHWNIEGRIVVDDNGGLGGCLPDACTIGIQWDSQTNLTLEWANYNGQPLPKERTIESLLPFVSLLVEDATPYTSGPLLPVG